MSYVLNTQRMRVVKVNDRGRVVKRRTFKRGDVVTEEDLAHIEGRFEALVDSGSLVDEADLADEEEPTPDADEGTEGSGADVDYASWDYDLLKATLEERNADRDTDSQIRPESMRKGAIAAALAADDEANPAEDEE